MSATTELLRCNLAHASDDMGDVLADRIRAVLQWDGQLSRDAADLAPDDSLHEAGLTAPARESLRRALEAEFNVDFPGHLVDDVAFASLAAIAAAVRELDAS